MKIPHRVKINRETYRVVYGDPSKAGGEKGDAGVCNPRTRLITLAPDIRGDRSEVEPAFWHEILHGIEAEFSVGISHGQIRRLANALYYICEDNGIGFARAPSSKPEKKK